MSSMASRIALVTGGASGLGRATAERFVREGARVVLLDLPRSESPGRSLVARLCDEHGGDRALFVAGDARVPEQVGAALDAAEEAFGSHVDTVINCAGIARARKTVTPAGSDGEGAWSLHGLGEFREVLDANVAGTFNVVRLAVERMLLAPEPKDGAKGDSPCSTVPRERGVVVNTSSIAAYEGQMGQVAYAASKAAVAGMTLPLARDLAPHGIRVNAIAPGLFRTPLLEGLPQRVRDELGEAVPFPPRLGEPDEFAALVQSIVENPMINAEVVRIDGGFRLPPR